MSKRLDKQPISRNGHRLCKGDVIKVGSKVCSCKVCSTFKDSFAIIAATQDEDQWLHANDCKGGEEPLLRLQTSKTPFGRTGCCFRACEVDFVSRETDSDWCIPFGIFIQ